MNDIDQAFSALSHKPGIEIWRVSPGYTLSLLPKTEHGTFFTGDAYIVLKVSALKSGGLSFAIHYWLGKGASKLDAKVAASKAIDLDAALGSKAASLLREAQGHESDLFLSYFRPCLIPIPGAQGVPEPQQGGEPQLWQVKGRRFVHVRQVPFARSSLSHGEIFVLRDGDRKAYQFNGSSCSKRERCKGLEVLQAVLTLGGGPKLPFAIVEDGDMTAPDSIEFWDLFGGFAPIAKRSALEDDMEARTAVPVLSWVSANGAAEMARGPDIRRQLLEASRCLIVDTGPKLYVWRGRTAPLEDKRAAAVAAEIILASANRPPATLVLYNSERMESAGFKELFSDWQGPRAGTEGGTKLKAAVLSVMWAGAGAGKLGAAGPAKQAPTQPLMPDGPYDLKVWRLNGREKHLLSAEEQGVFYSGDCYLVQLSFVRDRKGECLVFFWVGRHTTPEERVTCTAAAERAAETRGGQVTLVRVVQGKEPEQFFPLLKRNVFLLQGGLSKSYKAYAASQGGDDTYDLAQQGHLALFLVKPLPGGSFLATQMPLACRSLNSSECLVLLTPANPLVWIGGKAGDAEQAAAMAAAELLRPGVQPRKMFEGKETTVFLGHLGGRSDYPAHPESRDGPRELRLFHVPSAASNPLKVKEVPGFHQDDLASEDVLVLDTMQEVFVWVGAAVLEAEKKEAFAAGMRYVDLVAATESRSRDTTVIKLSEGYEVPMFTGFFDAWDPRKLGIFVDPYELRLGLLSGKTLDDFDVQKTKALAGHPSTEASQRAAAVAALQGTLAGEPTATPHAHAHAPSAPSAAPSSSATSQRQAAMAALKGSIAEAASETTSAAGSTSSSSSTPSEASQSSQRAAALAALRGSLPEESSSSKATPSAAQLQASPAGNGPSQGSAASQRAAALAALQGNLQGEKQAQGSSPGQGKGGAGTASERTPGRGKVGQLAVPSSDAEPSMSSSPSMSTQRAAALAALQGTLKEEGETFRKEAAKATPPVSPATPQVAPEEPEEASPGEEPQADGAISFPLSRLRISSTDPAPGIDSMRRESYLSNTEFSEALGMSKEKFYALPKWKQDQKKRYAGLY